MEKKIHLGFYMFTPMLGGAERLLRDLLFGINRERFKVSLFYESWPEFDAFLNLDNCPSIKARPLPILEPSGHIPTARDSYQIRKLKKSGLFDLTVVSSRVRAFYREHTPLYIREFFHFLRSSLYFGPNLIFLFWALRRKNINILHIINGGYPGAMSARCAALAAKFAGIPVCLMTVCASPAKRKFPQFIERKIDDLVYKCVDKFIVPAKTVGQLLTELREFGSSKISIIPWGVPMPRSYLADSAISDLRQSLKIPERVKIIGNIARFEARKGHHWLIEAISILAKKISNFHVVLVGEGPAKKEIEAQVKALDLEKIVTFTGYRPDTCEITQIFDIFVYPSILEGLPISILEAMSLKKPIVATPADGISEAITSGKTGLLVPPQNPSALAQAIERFLVNPELAKAMGKAAFARYEANYTLEQMIKQNEILYQELISKNQRPKQF